MAWRGRGDSTRSGQAAAGWLFTAPVLVILGLFLALPIIMALWVSVSDWTGRGSPFSGDVGFVGIDNYSALLTGGGLTTENFGIALRNNAWYVLLVVPIQTALSLALAVLVGKRAVRGRGFFRTALYFPSVTSSVAITVVFLFLFSASGVVNSVLAYLSIEGPNWFNDPRGVMHVMLGAAGVDQAPAFLGDTEVLGVSLWNWLAGPSVAMSVFIAMAVFTTSGTFMLLFIAALQNIPVEVDEAAMIDGANGRQRFFRVTLPQLRPTLFTVLTLGLIGTWQVFDQVLVATQGGPSNTTVTPAYLSYTSSFERQDWGQGAAIAFILFGIIVIMTLIQRAVLRERDAPRGRRRRRPPSAPLPADGVTGQPVPQQMVAGASAHDAPSPREDQR